MTLGRATSVEGAAGWREASGVAAGSDDDRAATTHDAVDKSAPIFPLRKGGAEELHSRSGRGGSGEPCLNETLSAGRAAAPGARVSADRVARASAERAKPAELVGLVETRPCERAGAPFQAMARAVVLAVAAACLFVGPAVAADLVVKPGDTGKLEYPIENIAAAGTNRRLEEVRLSVIVPENYAGFISFGPITIKEGAGITQPLTIEPGQTRTFVIPYQLAANVPEGSPNVEIHVEQLNVYAEPASLSTNVRFTVDSKAPALSFINAEGTPLLGENGLPVLIGDTIRAMAVTIRADDTGGSGIASITIIGPTPFEPTLYDGVAIADKTFTSLEDGAYIATVTDRAGNVSKISFTIGADRYPPLLTIRKNNAAGEILGDAGDTDVRTLYINATDIVLDARPRQTGISRIEIIGLDLHNDFENYIDYAGEADVSFSTTLPLGDYWIIATDREGNVAEKTFGIISATGPIASLFVPNYRQLYSEFRGVSVSTPSTVSVNTGQGGDDIFDPITGEPASSGVMYYTARGLAVGTTVPAPISQVRVTGANFNYVADYSPPRANVDVEGMGVLKAGTYQVTMKDVAQGETFMPFRIVDLTAYLCPDVQSAFVSTTTFTIDNFICLKSSLGLKSLQESTVNPPIADVGGVIPIQGTSLHYPSPATVHESKHVQRGFTITDIESNGTAFEARAAVKKTGFGGMNSTPGVLSVKSDPFDLKAHLQVPSARFIAGDGNVGFTEHIVHGATIDGSSQTVGRLVVRLDGAVIVDRKIALGAELPDQPFSGIRVIGRFPVLTAELSEVSVRGTVYPANCRKVNQANASLCDEGSIYFPWMSNVHGTIVGVAASVHPSVNYSANVFAGGPASVVLAPGVELGLPSHGPSKISLTLSSRKAPLRYKVLPSNMAYRVAAQINLFGQPATVSLPFSTTGLTPGQLAQLTVLQATKLNPGPNDFLPIPSRIANGKVISTTTNLSSPEGVEFMVVAPIHEDAHVLENADLAFQSNRSDIQLVASDISKFSLKKVLAILGAKGFVPVTPVYHLGPDGATFPEAGVIEMKFSDDQLARLGIAKSTLRILQFNGSGTVLEMPAQVLGDDKIAAKVPFLTSNFAVFGEGARVYVDLSPPQTTASYTGRTGTSAGGTILLDPGALVRLSAVDPEAPNFSISGVSQIRFLLDQVFIDTAATPGELYVSSFTLSTGAHSLAYYSVDHAGNVEPVIRASLFVAGPPAADTWAPQTAVFFSQAVSSDTAGRTVLDVLTEIGLSAIDPSMAGFPTSGVAQTRVLIDQTFIDTAATPGAVYVSTFTLSTGAHSLAYYSLDKAGNVEVARRLSLVVGPAFGDSMPPRTAFAARPPASSSGALTYVSPASLLGFFVVDDKTEAGDGLGAGATQTFYATDGGVYARFVSSFSLAVEGRHALSFYSIDRAGNVEARKEHALGVDATPPTSVLSSNGALYSISAVDALSGVAAILHWVDIDPASCVGVVPDTGAARGTCKNSAYAGPFALSGGQHAVYFQAIDVVGNREFLHADNVSVDLLPPRTTLLVNGPSAVTAPTLYVAGASFLGFDAADDKLAPGDGLGAGTTQTFYAIDAGAYARFSSSFGLAVEGLHSVSFFSVDREGNAEARNIRSVAVDLTPPVVALVSSGTLLAINAVDPVVAGAASGVAELLYLIDVDPAACDGVVPDTRAVRGTCANALYAGPFELTPGTHTVRFMAADRVGNESALMSQAITVTPDIKETGQGRFAFYFGSRGSEPGQFEGFVYDVAVDHLGAVYASDFFGSKINKYDADGNFLLSWGQPGSGPGQFGRGSFGVTISLDPHKNHVLATDPLYGRVQIFTSTGGFIGQIGPALAGSTHVLSQPSGTACDKAGNVYIADSWLNRIYKTDHAGNFLKTWITPSTTRVWHIRTGEDGNVYVTGGSWVYKFSPEGDLLQQFDHRGSTRGLDFDAARNLYVTAGCFSSHCIIVSDQSGAVISTLGTSNAGPGQMSTPNGVAVNKTTGRVYAADTFNHRIGVWDVVVPTSDIRVPITSIAPLGPTTTAFDGSLVVSPATPISFAVTDVASPGLAPSGVARTEYRLDGGALIVFAAPFTMNEVFTSLGYRLLEYRSIDKAGNVEAFQSRRVRVDAVAPQSAAYVDGMQMTNREGASEPLPEGAVTTASKLTIVALDFGRQGTAGVNSVLATLDGTPVALSTSSFRPWRSDGDPYNVSFDLAVPIREGPHTLSWQSTDRAGVAEQTRTLSFVAMPAPADPADNRVFRGATMLPGVRASDIAVDVFGNVYAASGSREIKKFASDGTLLFTFDLWFPPSQEGIGVGISPTHFVMHDARETRHLLAGRGTTATGFGTEEPHVNRSQTGREGFTNAVDAAFDGQGEIYVADAGARRISVFRPFEYTPRAQVGQGHFVDGPYRIAIGRDGVIYATDRGPARVLKFSAGGEPLGEWRGPLKQASGLGVDLHGNVYVSDAVDNLVYVFSSTGGVLAQFGGTGSGPSQLLNPAGLDVHLNSGRVYVADNGNSRIQVFTLDPPPAAVEDLSAAAAPDTEVLLRWTAPGDDAMTGRAASYVLRYATAPILTSAAFLNSTPVSGLAAPRPAGSPESFLAAGLPGGTTLYFALQTTDLSGGVSGVSNSAAIRLPFLTRSMAAVDGKAELAFSIPGVQPSATLLSSATTAGAVVLASATAQGLAAVSSVYDLAPEGVLFDPPGMLAMRYSTRTLAQLGLSEADVALYRFDSQLGWVKVAGQIIDTDRKLVTVNLSSIASIFAVLAIVRDDVSPVTILQTFGGSAFAAAGGLYVSSPTSFGFSSFDPLKLGIASGVDFTEFRIDAATPGASFQTFAAPFMLAEGAHSLDFRSRDKAGNQEAAKSRVVTVDVSAPVIGIASPLGGETFVARQSSIAVRVAALDNFDPSPRFEAFLVQLEDRGSPRGDRPSRVAVSSEQVIQPLEIDDGLWTLEVKAADFVENSAAAVSRPFEVIHDIRPPRTSASIGEPRFIVAGSTYVTGRTPLSLPAVDDLLVAGDGVGLGVRKALFAVDADSFSVLAGSMTISAEGLHAWKFFSVDVVGNMESTQTLALQVDDTAPVSTVTIGAPLFTGTNGTLFVSSTTPFTLSAVDPDIRGAASGLKDTSLSIDAGTFEVSSGAFTLSPQDGSRTLRFFSRDNLLNNELVGGAAVALDNTAPATSLAVLGGRQFPGPNATSFYASSDTRFALPAFDPTVNGVASGLALTQWQDNGGAFSTFASPFSVPEGAHTLSYQSQDRVQNLEVLRSTSVFIDVTPPVTTARLGAPLFTTVDGINYITPATSITFTAVDPTVSAVASGVNRVEVAVDGGAFAAYTSALTFAEGRHTILYRAVDNVANLETVQTLQVQSDATPPASSLAIGSPSFDPGAGQPVFVAAATLLTLSAQDPVVLNVASGVRQISFRRGGDSFGTYLAPFALPLPDGLKTLDYLATDNVGNQEASRSTTVALDNTPPLTMLAVLGGRQFPGPNATSFYASSDTRLALAAADPVVGGVASGLALTQWQDNSGVFQSFAAAFGLAEGSHLLAYQSRDQVRNLEVLRSTTVLVDATPPVSSVFIGAPAFVASDGTIYIAPATPVTLSAVDPSLPAGQPGSGVSRIEVAIDGGNFAAYSSALTFAEGRHTILYRAVDNVVNVEVVRTLQVRSDATPPVSSLVIGTPQFQLPSVLLVSTRTPFSIAPVDPIVGNVAAGVKDTSFRVSDLAPGAGVFSAFAAPFAMAGADVGKVIEFYSRDNVLNAEIVKSSAVLLDSTPPEVALLSPASCGAGICRVLKGKFPVLGTACDSHFGDYRLEFAPGQDASTGFALISSATLAVSSGTLGTWDATALSGWLTLRLTAADLVANAAAVSLNVFVGDPGQSLVLGNHEVFDMPEGVAAGGDGTIYVADRNNDRIAVFSSTGALLVSLGGRKDDDDEDDDDNKHKKSTATLRLNKPSGVAVDGAGNVYVADTNRDRVLKLSADGQVLLTLGRPEREHENEHARLPGQFHQPAGVAVDAASNIYVADTGNRRVQVFSSTGVFHLQFDLPPVPARLDNDDEKGDDDDEERVQLGKPSAIAVDAAGNIYVADSKGGRALKFSAAGRLLLTISIPGDKPGKQGQPFGVAVSSGGDCLLVSDRKTSRILKFDFLGNSNLIFGGKGKIKDDDDAPVGRSAIVFKKPMGLALDSQGNLFVADRNNNRIQRLGLPTGQAPLVVPPPKPGEEHIARDVVDTEDGGKVERGDRAAVDIPAGAVAWDLKISVSTPAFSTVDDSNRRRAAENAKLKTASPPVEYGPEGTKFKGEVTLTLPYSPELVALQKIDAKDLKVRYWNRGKSEWEDLESVIDPKTRTVKAKTTHFSLYQVFSGTVSAAALQPLVADAAFTFHDAYAFPNPGRGGGPITIRMQTGLADSVEVRVYDVSGRKIHSSSNFSLNPSLDDGNGKGEQYTYDHVWDVSGVGSGVYQFVITSKKSGHRDIHKAGRIGLIK